MATVILSWIPAGGENSKSQDILMKVNGSSNWSIFQNVSPLVNTIEISGLEDNTKYDFQIVDNCVYGGPVSSAIASGIKITCPSLSFTNIYNKIQFAFNHLGGSIDHYYVDLYDGNSNLLSTLHITSISSVITGNFNEVSPNTNYKLLIIAAAGGISQSCPVVTTSTPPPPVCDAPINVRATLR
jgi:hypothetical protein